MMVGDVMNFYDYVLKNHMNEYNINESDKVLEDDEEEKKKERIKKLIAGIGIGAGTLAIANGANKHMNSTSYLFDKRFEYKQKLKHASTPEERNHYIGLLKEVDNKLINSKRIERGKHGLINVDVNLIKNNKKKKLKEDLKLYRDYYYY